MPQTRPIHRAPHTSTPAPAHSSRSKKHKTISTASILKRKPMAALYTHRRRHRHRASHHRHREKSGHPLMRDYQDDVAKCRDSAESNAAVALSDAHAKLVAKVDKIKSSNTTTLSTLQTQSEALLAPLEETEVDTATTGNAEVGKQIEMFRAQLAAGEKELKHLWELWDEAQGEIEKLGREGAGDMLKGWEEEVRERIGEMEEEAGEAGREAVKAMGEAEKEIDKKLREDHEKLVATMFRGE
ncbi:hypothetical protein VC83_03877 [Pseudogymnoascus destructans]|uniref:Uncharacterized protein n=2 Tax=Pseudogymnoascus destructans TaxID=655981 RepID=L8G6C9_PSED2|nr:uncharacterized protein VC83_03877 [Pseudogymnoascus destructans]ELR08647.1 hypothetical protein GMDG_03333 [Pseudogymnoascus destructans 20631-21]OAF59831.1 hypothetical protein VC83_03877 [Pseudogymnoascus destructans]